MTLSPQRLRHLAWALCALPMVWLTVQAFTLNLGANPVETLEHETGGWALVLLLFSLGVTPVRRLTGWNALAPLRRTLGLFAFSYACVHVLVYALLDRSLLWSELVLDLTKRPYVMLGAAAFMGLLVLAVTSPKRVVKKLGATAWRRMHMLVYAVATLAVAHFTWLKWDKNLLDRPAMYAAVLAVLLAWRIWFYYRSSSGRN
ncbi:MAG TPA: protein-methionine-sulfoxide reductase heme-binding subunit MsrQ [Limnobacter sp.]|nr:protein-methionine-sulfoxide reductase heme-binding subunit MsrQ [Limnobacter sp.]